MAAGNPYFFLIPIEVLSLFDFRLFKINSGIPAPTVAVIFLGEFHCPRPITPKILILENFRCGKPTHFLKIKIPSLKVILVKGLYSIAIRLLSLVFHHISLHLPFKI